MEAGTRFRTAALRASLADAGDVTIQLFPDLYHLLQPAETGAIDEYGTIEITIFPEVLELVASWIGERFGRS